MQVLNLEAGFLHGLPWRRGWIHPPPHACKMLARVPDDFCHAAVGKLELAERLLWQADSSGEQSLPVEDAAVCQMFMYQQAGYRCISDRVRALTNTLRA